MIVSQLIEELPNTGLIEMKELDGPEGEALCHIDHHPGCSISVDL
jgi:hypothetical protein|tara:strand:+ start:608 stop:742 length:135 start_codon:yes stop_codon:yes gene_type:complete